MYDMSLCKSYTCSFFFFFNDTATTEIYTLSLHDALPISYLENPDLVEIKAVNVSNKRVSEFNMNVSLKGLNSETDRKSTRLNSSHSQISYAVFCLKKKKHEAPEKTPLS